MKQTLPRLGCGVCVCVNECMCMCDCVCACRKNYIRRYTFLLANTYIGIVFHVHMCYIQVQGYDKLKFFKEADIYWTPATTTSGLYSQLFEYKYRELLRSQIRSEEAETPYA